MNRFSFAALMSVISCQHLAEDLHEERMLIGLLTGHDSIIGEDDHTQRRRAQTALFEQFPQLTGNQMQFAKERLTTMLEAEFDDQNRREIAMGWLLQQAQRLDMNIDELIEVHEPVKATK